VEIAAKVFVEANSEYVGLLEEEVAALRAAKKEAKAGPGGRRRRPRGMS
jgi:hypothetical protein